MNDIELKKRIRECLNGRKESFSCIVKTFQVPIYHFAYHFTGNPEEARDASMEIFFKVYRGLASFKPGYKFSTWLYKIAFNHLVEVSRRMKRENRYFGSEMVYRTDVIQTETPDSIFFKNEDREEVKSVLQSISLNSRTALMLRYYHQLSYQQISRIMDIPKNTVASFIFRGKKELRAKLGREEI